MRRPNHTTRSLAVLICAVAVQALLVGCGGGGSSSGTAGIFVGHVTNTRALIAIVTDGTEVRSYLCDGTPDGQLVVAEWFKGQKSGDTINLVSNTGIVTLNAQVTPGGVTGTVTLPVNQVLSFQAAPATGDAGLYGYKQIHNNTLHWAGWVVLNDGQQAGAQIFPQVTSQGVTLNTATGVAQIPQAGAVSPLKVTVSNAKAFQQGCTGFGCNGIVL